MADNSALSKMTKMDPRYTQHERASSRLTWTAVWGLCWLPGGLINSWRNKNGVLLVGNVAASLISLGLAGGAEGIPQKAFHFLAPNAAMAVVAGAQSVKARGELNKSAEQAETDIENGRIYD